MSTLSYLAFAAGAHGTSLANIGLLVVAAGLSTVALVKALS